MFENIKVGDRVILRYDSYGIGEIKRVERLTNTLIIVKGEKFRKKDGGRCGGRGFRTIYEYTEEAVNEIHEAERKVREKAKPEREIAINSFKKIDIEKFRTREIESIVWDIRRRGEE